MKALLLLLVLANFLYAGWRLWIVPSEAPPAFVEADGVPRLELLDLAPGSPEAAADTEPLHDGELSVAAIGSQAGSPQSAGDLATESGRADDDLVSASDAQTDGTADIADTAEVAVAAASATEPGLDADGELALTNLTLVQKPLRCVSLGPFLNLREATEATAMLNEIGLQPGQRLAESQVWFGHWVFLPEQPSRAEAIRIVESLREKGISDIYIEPSGPFRNHISLGVFTDAEHAETRAGHIRRLGVSPQIRDRYRDSSVYWVDFSLPADRNIDPSAYQSSPSRVLRLEPRDCPPDNTG